MRALVSLVMLGLAFYVVWRFMARGAAPRARLGPDTTTTRDPEAVTVNDEGEGQAISPPSHTLRYGNEMAAPGAPPDAMDSRRDVELAEEVLPVEPVRARGRVLHFRGRVANRPAPEPAWSEEIAEEIDWAGLNDPIPLPAHYNEEAITALVRNPRSLYVYWERSGEADLNLLKTLGEAAYGRSKPCLRVVDVTPGAAAPGQTEGEAWLVEVSDLDDHWFVQDGIEPDHTYEVSFGRRTDDGRFILLSHSQPVHTPHETAAPEAKTSMLYRIYGTQPDDHPSGSPQWR